MHCSRCNHNITQKSSFCPNCGNTLRPLQGAVKNSNNTKTVLIVLALVLGSCLLCSFVGAILNISESKKTEKKISKKEEPKKKIELPFFKVEKELKNPTSGNATFYVRLRKRISKDQIELIGGKIKKDNPTHNSYWIFYHLPKMRVGNGAWAKSEIESSHSIEFYGATLADAKKMLSAPPPDGKVLGKWFREIAGGYLIIIFQQKDTIKIRRVYKDGSSKDEVIKKRGQKLYDDDSDEYFKIEKDGSLGLYNIQGQQEIIGSAERSSARETETSIEDTKSQKPEEGRKQESKIKKEKILKQIEALEKEGREMEPLRGTNDLKKVRKCGILMRKNMKRAVDLAKEAKTLPRADAMLVSVAATETKQCVTCADGAKDYCKLARASIFTARERGEN